jgi:hypothetical protein
MNFHPRWSRPVGGFDHGGYHTGDDRYIGFDQQQDMRSHSQENWTVQNPKSDQPISLKKSEAPRQPHRQLVRKSKSSTESSGNGQEKEGPRDETSANDRAEQNMEKGPKKTAVE